MGGFFGRFWRKVFAHSQEVKLLIVGLDAAGKTTLLYSLKESAPLTAKRRKVTGKTGLIAKDMPLSSAVPQHDEPPPPQAVVGLGVSAQDGFAPAETQFQLHQKVTPTIGFNLDEFRFKNVKIKMWDLAGQERLRSVWSHYFMAVQGIIFVLDSADSERFLEVREELHKILSDNELLKVPVLVMANKQDLPDAVPIDKLRAELAL